MWRPSCANVQHWDLVSCTASFVWTRQNLTSAEDSQFALYKREVDQVLIPRYARLCSSRISLNRHRAALASRRDSGQLGSAGHFGFFSSVFS